MPIGCNELFGIVRSRRRCSVGAFIAKTTKHQLGNAKYLADRGAAWLVNQADFTPQAVAKLISGMTRESLLEHAQAARAIAAPDAAAKVADLIEEVVASPGAEDPEGLTLAREYLPPLRRTTLKFLVNHLHFVGIGGAGMSGIAEVLLNLGYVVSGSDIAASPVTERLQSLGARISLGHDRRTSAARMR